MPSAYDWNTLECVYHHYAAGRDPVKRPRAQTIEELQAQIDGFLRKHPIPEDREATKRIDAILAKRKANEKQNQGASNEKRGTRGHRSTDDRSASEIRQFRLDT